MFFRCFQGVCRIFPGCFQDAPMGLVGLVEFDDHFKWKYGLQWSKGTQWSPTIFCAFSFLQSHILYLVIVSFCLFVWVLYSSSLCVFASLRLGARWVERLCHLTPTSVRDFFTDDANIIPLFTTATRKPHLMTVQQQLWGAGGDLNMALFISNFPPCRN